MTGSSLKKVAFIQNITEQLHGYMCMSAVLKLKGYACDVFVDNLEKDILKKIDEFKPDILGFYCVTGNLNWGVSLMREYKKNHPKCLMLLGGPHPSYCPEEAFEDGIDALSIGESEEAILEVCEKFDGTVESIRNLKNIYTVENSTICKNPLRHLIDELDTLPLPDRGIYDKYRYFTTLDTVSVMASRGCPFNCTYCHNQNLKSMYKDLGKFLRFRSPEHIARELNGVIKRYKNLRYFIFVDSTLNADHRWLMEFLEFYRKNINIPFFCHIRADITISQQVDALAKANCRVIAFGIEGGSYRLRRDILKRDMKDDVIIKVARMIKDKNILLCTANIFGLPTETLEESYGLIRINQIIKTDVPTSTIFQPYPGTELGRIAKEKGLIENLDYNSLHGYYHHSVLKQKDIKMQERIHKMSTYYIRFPRLTFIWDFLTRNAPFSLLHVLFLISVTVNIKRIYGYSASGILRYGLLNFKLFFRNKDMEILKK